MWIFLYDVNLRLLGFGLNGQRGSSSATRPELAEAGDRGSTPAEEGPSPAAILAEIIDSRNIEHIFL